MTKNCFHSKWQLQRHQTVCWGSMQILQTLIRSDKLFMLYTEIDPTQDITILWLKLDISEPQTCWEYRKWSDSLPVLWIRAESHSIFCIPSELRYCYILNSRRVSVSLNWSVIKVNDKLHHVPYWNQWLAAKHMWLNQINNTGWRGIFLMVNIQNLYFYHHIKNCPSAHPEADSEGMEPC